MAIYLVWICGIFAQRWLVCETTGASKISLIPASAASPLIPYFPDPRVRCYGLTSDLHFFLHEMVMSSRCEIKMLWLTYDIWWLVPRGLQTCALANYVQEKLKSSVGIRSSQTQDSGPHIYASVDPGMPGPAIANNIFESNGFDCRVWLDGAELWNHSTCRHSSVKLRVTLRPPLVYISAVR